MGIGKPFLILSFLLCSLAGIAQQDYASRFFLGKQYFEQGKNDLAMQILLSVSNNDPENKYREESAYLYAIAAMNDSLFFQARQMLLQICTRYSYWDKVDEARLRLVVCYFHAKEPGMAIENGNLIKDESLSEELNEIKYYYLSRIQDKEFLKKLYGLFPNDEVIAFCYANILSATAGSEEEMVLLESLIDVFRFNPETLNRSVPSQKVYKDVYNISVFLPFKYASVKSKTQYDKNKFAYEFYAGVLQAADSLKRRGINLNIRPFDTKGDTSVLKNLLRQRIALESDLIIGPLYPELSEIMMDFGEKNKIIVVNPFSQNEESVKDRAFAYLFQTSFHHISRIQSQFAIDSLLGDTAAINMLVMDKTDTDTAMAAIIWNYLKINGHKIDTLMVFERSEPEQLLNIFGDSSHIEDFTNMFVTSSNRVIIGRIIAAVEAGNSQANILGTSRWLEYDNVDLQQMERRHVYFPHPDYVNFENPYYQNFRKTYQFENVPGFYSETGFEIMMQFGLSLHRHGKYFQDALRKEGYRKGFIFGGIDYSRGNFNAYAPLMKVSDGKIIPVGYRPQVNILNPIDNKMIFEADSTEIIVPEPGLEIKEPQD